MHNVIQIAGVIDQAEAEMLVACGVEYLGFPLRLPDGREDLSETDAAAIIRALPPTVRGVLITYLDDAETIVQMCCQLGVTTVQLHGPVSLETITELRHMAPDLTVIKSLIVCEDNLDELRAFVAQFSPYVQAFITDTFDPQTGRSGATGKTHDWTISRHLVEISPQPVILAGGLTPDNVRDAIAGVRPAGVDAHTGVEDRHGRKDPHLVRRFVAAARQGFNPLQGAIPRSVLRHR